MSIPIRQKSPSYNIIGDGDCSVDCKSKVHSMNTPTKTRSKSCLNTSILGWSSHRRITSKPSKHHCSLVKARVTPNFTKEPRLWNEMYSNRFLYINGETYLDPLQCKKKGQLATFFQEIIKNSATTDVEFIPFWFQVLLHMHDYIFQWQGYKGVHIEEKSIDETYIDVTLWVSELQGHSLITWCESMG